MRCVKNNGKEGDLDTVLKSDLMRTRVLDSKVCKRFGLDGVRNLNYSYGKFSSKVFVPCPIRVFKSRTSKRLLLLAYNVSQSISLRNFRSYPFCSGVDGSNEPKVGRPLSNFISPFVLFLWILPSPSIPKRNTFTVTQVRTGVVH